MLSQLSFVVSSARLHKVERVYCQIKNPVESIRELLNTSTGKEIWAPDVGGNQET